MCRKSNCCTCVTAGHVVKKKEPANRPQLPPERKLLLYVFSKNHCKSCCYHNQCHCVTDQASDVLPGSFSLLLLLSVQYHRSLLWFTVVLVYAQNCCVSMKSNACDDQSHCCQSCQYGLHYAIVKSKYKQCYQSHSTHGSLLCFTITTL